MPSNSPSTWLATRPVPRHSTRLVCCSNDSRPCTPGTYYIGLYATKDTEFMLVADLEAPRDLINLDYDERCAPPHQEYCARQALLIDDPHSAMPTSVALPSPGSACRTADGKASISQLIANSERRRVASMHSELGVNSCQIIRSAVAHRSLFMTDDLHVSCAWQCKSETVISLQTRRARFCRRCLRICGGGSAEADAITMRGPCRCLSVRSRFCCHLDCARLGLGRSCGRVPAPTRGDHAGGRSSPRRRREIRCR